jgi:hypothetical protein
MCGAQETLRRLCTPASRDAPLCVSTSSGVRRAVATLMTRTGCTSFLLPLDLDVGEDRAKMTLVVCKECSGAKRVCGPSIAREVHMY